MNYYEIHVTVKTDDIEGFKKTCEELDVKPIVIDLQNRTGKTIFHDVMTSSKVTGEWQQHLDSIAMGLAVRGFQVVRRKVEESPYNDECAPSIYYESHIRVRCKPERVDELRELTKQRPWMHLSRNVFKTCENGDVYMMITDRRKEDFGRFKVAIMQHQALLSDHGFAYDKVEMESAIYDSKESHDEKWIYS